MKFSKMTLEQINEEMVKLQTKSNSDCTWLHKNKRWVGLLNEKAKR